MSAVKIVGIGASAGGLKALEEFFSHLPSDLGLVYVIIQHLSPEHPSTLHEILARCTDMPVMQLQTGLVPDPDHVYIKPADQDLEVISGSLQLTERKVNSGQLYLPINSFFSSLATDQQESAIGIVLSGTGSDGSHGLREIKEQGGLVMVQSPASATFDGMPNAVIRLNICDLILPANELAQHLAHIARYDGRLQEVDPELNQLSNSEILREILARVEQVSRLDFTKYRESTIRRRLEKRMLIRQKNTIREYAELALSENEELARLQQSFLIGVTRFFRDEEVFELLRTEVLPRILDGLKPQEPIRIWVPACSTGEEAYSIGILVQELLKEREEERELKIFASDVDTQAIQIATRGQYDRAILADVPEPLLHTYFKPEKNYYRIIPSLREKILFAVQNLLVDPPFINMDLVSCRNFLIYVKNTSQTRVLNNFHFALKPGAFLLLGPSEHLGSLSRAFSTLNRRWNLFQKKEQREDGLYRPPRRDSLSSLKYPAPKLVDPVRSPVEPPPSSTGSFISLSDRGMFDGFSQLLSERYAPPSIFVTPDYGILYLNGEFEGLLHLPKFMARLHLDKVLDAKLSILFRAGVDAVLKSGQSSVIEKVRVTADSESPRWAKVHFAPVELEHYQDTLVLIEVHFQDAEIEAPESDDVPDNYTPNETLRNQVHTLQRELKTARAKTQKLLNELEATNEELQTSNRELMASNEEMQSTNEELQSVNEELYTVNSELQLKNEELRNSESDISNLLKSTEIGTVFLNKELEIRRFTPAVRKQFDLHDSDIGRRITSFSNSFFDLDIEAICREVLDNLGRYEREIKDQDNNFYLLRVLPYRNDQDQVDGLVITFVAIDDLVIARKRLVAMAKMYEAIIENSRDTIAVVTENSRIEEINHSFGGKTPSALLDTYFTDLLSDDTQRAKFTKAIRRVFDQEESIRRSLQIAVDGAEGERVGQRYVIIEFIPTVTFVDHSEERLARRATLLIRDVTEEELEKQETKKLLAEYKDAIEKSERQGGLIDMNGNIVHLNRSREADMSVEDYLQQSIYDFLTSSGRQLYDAAIKRIKQGSFREIVAYQAKDLRYGAEPVAVEYQPIISNGEIIFINVHEVPKAG